MNTKTAEEKKQKLKVTTDIVRTYYVQTDDGWIYGGPFDSKEEARQCLKDARPHVSPQRPRETDLGYMRRIADTK